MGFFDFFRKSKSKKLEKAEEQLIPVIQPAKSNSVEKTYAQKKFEQVQREQANNKKWKI